MSQLSQASILIVDEDAESRLAIASILISNHYRVVIAKDAPAAVELAQSETLDLLITDIRIGQWSGQELISTLRQAPEKMGLPVMFVSAHQCPGVIRRAFVTGDAYQIKKPIDGQVLTELVEKAVKIPGRIGRALPPKSPTLPHVTFLDSPDFPNPLANPFDACSIFPGSPIAF
jgi:putative two-component system response regulator